MKIRFVLLFALAQLPALAAEVPRGARCLEDCLEAALARQPGRVIKVELKETRTHKAYEFDIQGRDGHAWDVECHADKATVVSVEREVETPAHPLFAAKARITTEEAKATALAAHPGEVEEIEFEIEEDGSASYEFDIAHGNGRKTKLEVDAATGELIEVDKELWQIGFE